MVAAINSGLVPVQVPFHGDTLEAVQDENGKVWVSLKRGCENLGLSIQGQLSKLKGKPWAVVKENFTTGPDGKTYSMAMIDLDCLPMWLATIDPRKVKEQIREKLARYQREAAKVLADHFYGRKPAQPAFDMGQLASMLRAMVRDEVQAIRQPERIASSVPRWTVKERCRFKGWHGTSYKTRNKIRQLANTLLDLFHQETPDVWGQCHTYYGHQIVKLDEAIDRVRAEYDRRGGDGMFSGVRS